MFSNYCKYLSFFRIHYDTKSSDNIEKCIEKFGDFLTESAVTVKVICSLITLIIKPYTNI